MGGFRGLTVALLLSDFLPNLVLSGDDNEAAAASALSASSFPFDFVVGICAAAVASRSGSARTAEVPMVEAAGSSAAQASRR